MDFTSPLFLGNLVSLIACSISAASGYVKSKNKTLIMQTIQQAMSMTACIILQSPSGAVLNALSVPRNLLACKNKLNFPAKLILSVLSGGFGLFFAVSVCLQRQTFVLAGFLPIIPTILYTVFLDTQDPVKFKLLVIQMITFWTIHDFLIQSYTSCFFNLFQIIFSISAIIRIRKEQEAQQNESVKQETSV